MIVCCLNFVDQMLFVNSLQLKFVIWEMFSGHKNMTSDTINIGVRIGFELFSPILEEKVDVGHL